MTNTNSTISNLASFQLKFINSTETSSLYLILVFHLGNITFEPFNSKQLIHCFTMYMFYLSLLKVIRRDVTQEFQLFNYLNIYDR